MPVDLLGLKHAVDRRSVTESEELVGHVLADDGIVTAAELEEEHAGVFQWAHCLWR